MSDLISREALRKAMYHEVFETDSDDQKWDSGCWIRYKMFERVLEGLPSAQPGRKKGKWISKGYGEYRCSSCRNIVDLDEEILMSIKRFDYCPVCGADMRSESNEQSAI